MLLVDDSKQLGITRGTLRRPKKQEALGFKRIVKYLRGAMLQTGVKVDKQVAAADQIEFREGRVLHQVVHGEHAQVANFLGRAIFIAFFTEPALETRL